MYLLSQVANFPWQSLLPNASKHPAFKNISQTARQELKDHSIKNIQ